MLFQQRTDAETGVMALAYTDGDIRRDAFAHGTERLRTFRAGGFLIPGDIELCQPFRHLDGNPVVQHRVCLDHDVAFRTDSLAHGFGDVERQVLLFRRQGQVGGKVFAIEIVRVGEGVELQPRKTGVHDTACLGGIVRLVVSAARKPVVGIEQDIFPVSPAQQFVAGNAQHLCFQVEQRHVDTADRTQAGSVRADPVQIAVELRPDKIGLHRVEADDALSDMLSGFENDRAAGPVSSFAYAGIAFVGIDFQ